MALAQQTKNGGRYTKKQQEERRFGVYQLHFGENKSALEISKLLGINRNTINDDIRFWNAQVADKIGTDIIVEKMKGIILKKYMQQDRLIELLEECQTSVEKLQVEKFISEGNTWLWETLTKLHKEEPSFKLVKRNIDEKIIENFVRDLIISNPDPSSKDIYSTDQLEFEFIRRYKGDRGNAYNVIGKMILDGMSLCEHPEFKDPLFRQDALQYNLEKFAKLRGYLSDKELDDIHQKRINTKGTKKNDEGFQN